MPNHPAGSSMQAAVITSAWVLRGEIIELSAGDDYVKRIEG